MKPITAIIVFFSLMFPALFLGYNNYAEAKENIIKDVNQALAKTVIYKMHYQRFNVCRRMKAFHSILQAFLFVYL